MQKIMMIIMIILITAIMMMIMMIGACCSGLGRKSADGFYFKTRGPNHTVH
jgi:hypothetical protein